MFLASVKNGSTFPRYCFVVLIVRLTRTWFALVSRFRVSFRRAIVLYTSDRNASVTTIVSGKACDHPIDSSLYRSPSRAFVYGCVVVRAGTIYESPISRGNVVPITQVFKCSFYDGL